MQESERGTFRLARWLVAWVTTLSVLLPRPLFAQSTPTEHQSLARELFARGRELMNRGVYGAACPKLAESFRIDPGGGTLLNLALCHELEGKTATAWTEFNEAARLARIAGRPDRVDFAERHALPLVPRLARISIHVPPHARTPGLLVRLNGAPIGDAGWGEPLPVDPGSQVLEAQAPGKRHARYLLVLKAGERREFSVSPLEDDDRWPLAKRIGFGLILSGGVAAAVATAFGVHAMREDGEADDGCRANVCGARAIEASRNAAGSGRLATVSLAMSGALSGSGAALWLWSSSDAAKQGPSSGADVSVGFGGSF